MKKMPTGVPGLDEIFAGGLIENHSHLLVGSAGAGKTILSLQWLNKGIEQGERCLYITLTERSIEIKRNAVCFNWALDKVDIVDLSPQGKVDSTLSDKPIEEYTVFLPSEVERASTWELIYNAIKEFKPQRLVIDSSTQLHYLSVDEYQFRKQILNLLAYLNQQGTTTFLLFEPTELERESSLALAVDCVVYLRMDISKNRAMALRCLQISKLRGSDFLSGCHAFNITDKGIHIFPHRIEKLGTTNPGQYLMASGLTQLDELLHGGLESGTTTIISGPTGVGKSTLGVQFLINTCTPSSRAVIYTFTESTNSIINRCESIGIPIKQKLEQDMIRIEKINSMEIYPDQFLETVRVAVEQEKFDLVMIDSLQDYNLAMEQYDTLLLHIQNLVTYLNSHNATTILINDVESITGTLNVTELGASYFSDNTILLRYAEHQGEIIKVIACLKKRLSDFQPELRKFSLTAKGLKVSEKLENLQGILTGTPTSVK